MIVFLVSSLFINLSVYSDIGLFYDTTKPKLQTEGTETGNGGFTISCPLPNKSEEFNFLDTYGLLENMYYSYSPVFEKMETSQIFEIETRVKGFLFNLQKLDPKLKERLETYYDSFWIKTRMKSEGESFIEVEPKHGLNIPSNCRIQQVVSRIVTNHPPYDMSYVIDGYLFKKMSQEQQVATIIHELLYSELNASGSEEAFSNLIIYNRFLFNLPNLFYTSKNELLLYQAQNTLTRFKTLYLNSYYSGYSLMCRSIEQYINDGNDLEKACGLSLYPSGKVKRAYIVSDSYKVPANMQGTDYEFFIIYGDTEFDESGRIISTQIHKSAKLPILRSYKPDKFEYKYCYERVYLNDRGYIYDCR